MKALQTKIASFNTLILMEIVKGLNTSFEFEQDLIFDLALSELENRLGESKFIELCSSL